MSGSGFIAQRYALGGTAPERQAEGIVSLAGFLETLRVPLVQQTPADCRLIRPQVFVDQIDDDDRPIVVGARELPARVSAVLAAIVLVSMGLTALRAVRIDPILALRAE